VNILLVLIPVTLLVVVVAVWLFFWAVNHQQFDDLDSPAVLPLLDEPASKEAEPAPPGPTDQPDEPS
jgi:cbb3-type cytochrome oxidase maturation protein